MGNFSVALLNKMLSSGESPGVIVHQYLVGLHFVAGPIEKHDGNAAFLQIDKMVMAQRLTGDRHDQAIGAAFGDVPDIGLLALVGLVALVNHHVVAPAVGYVLYSADGRGKKRIIDVRHNDPNGLGLVL